VRLCHHPVISISTVARSLLALAPLAAVETGMGEFCSGTPAAQAQPGRSSRIELPVLLAIELPAPGMTSIGPGASPLKELLESALARVPPRGAPSTPASGTAPPPARLVSGRSAARHLALPAEITLTSLLARDPRL